MIMMMSQQQVFVIRILVYSEKTHQFLANLDIQQRSFRHGGRMVNVSLHTANEQGILPSTKWMQDYQAWNNFQNHPAEFKGHPVFSSVEALYEFNDKGAELVARLRQELASKSNVKIEDYLPLFSNIKVGDAVSAWWHIKDQNYNYVVPVQHLPVSDNLKSRIMAWRVRKGKNWLDDTCCRSLNQEGHDIEEHILWELNVRENKDGSSSSSTNNPPPTSNNTNVALSRQSSFESVHHFAPVHQAEVVIE